MNHSERHRPIYLLFALLALAGAVCALLSLDLHLQVAAGRLSGPSFCNLGEALNCERIAASPWSEIGGVPLAAIGLWYYVMIGLLSGAVLVGLVQSGAIAAVLWTFSSLSAVLSVALFLIAEFSVGTLCLLCFGMYLVNFAQAGLASRMLVGAPGGAFVAGFRSLALAPLRVFSKPAERGASVAIMIPVLVALVLTIVLWERAKRSGGGAPPIAGAVVAEWQAGPVVQLANRLGAGPNTDYQEGPADAPVTIVEFADIQCAFCRQFYLVIHDLLARHPGKIRLIYRHFPLDPSCNRLIPAEGHPYACFSAELVRCAGEQGRAKEALDLVFTSTVFDRELSPKPFQAELLSEARKQGMDVAALGECLNSDRQLKFIKDDIEEGERIQLHGTPTIFVNGRRVPASGMTEAGLGDIVAAALRASHS